MKVLVTGGAGFIGSHVVEQCLTAGYQVAVLDNFCTGKRENIPDNVRVYELDITDEVGVGDVLREFSPDVICHLAAQISVGASLKNPVNDARQNIIGTLVLLEGIRNMKKPAKMVYSNSAAVYGDAASLPIVESDPLAPISPYGLSKQVAADYIALYEKQYQLRATILRYSNVFGPRQDPHGEAGVCALYSDAMLAGGTPVIYGDGSATRDYVYVKDVARANVLACTRGDGETVNICSNTQTTTLQVFQTFARAFNYSAQPEYLPARPADIEHSFMSNERARDVLEWSPQTTFTEGVEETAAWYKSGSSHS